MNERSSNVYVKICISFQSDLADRYYWVRPEGTTVGELKQQLLQDLNWRRPTEIEVIEIGPFTFKEENKKGDDSKRKQAIYLLDSEAIPKKITNFECKLNIPESCKWISKKRGRKAFENQQQKKDNGGEIDDDDEDAASKREFRFSPQAISKQQQPQQETIKVRPTDSDETESQENKKKTTTTTTTVINDYSPKKLKTSTLAAADVDDHSEQQHHHQRIEIKSIPLVKLEQKTTPNITKSLDLIYTNKLFEIKKRIWSEDLTQDETEKIISEFEAFRRVNRPEILSKQTKDSLRETDARFAYLIDKWDIDINPLLALKCQN